MNATTNQEREVLDLQPIERAALPTHQSASFRPSDLLRMAIDQGADLDRLERLMDLQDRWERREAEKAYNVAFSDFKAEAVRIMKAKTVTDGPLKGKSYAELHNVVDAVTPALSRHGLSAAWKVTRDEKDWLEVTCTLKHTSGHSESVSMGGMPDTGGAKNALQARASSLSYLSRYTLKAICGVAEGGDDSDGNTPAPTVPLELLAAARDAAMGGWPALAKHIKSLTPADRALLEPASYELKKAAKAVDEKDKQ